MRRHLRLRSSRQFTQIRREGQTWVNSLLVLRALSNDTAETHFGLVTTRRIGNAVVRNKVRRKLREILRTTPVKAGWDLVFIVRKRSVDSDYHRLKEAAHNLLQRGSLLEASSVTKTTQC